MGQRGKMSLLICFDVSQILYTVYFESNIKSIFKPIKLYMYMCIYMYMYIQICSFQASEAVRNLCFYFVLITIGNKISFNLQFIGIQQFNVIPVKIKFIVI